MESFTTLIHQGGGWLFIPSAILLGALHGLEPGHSKTMMAAFIVAIRGTIGQAILLAIAATFSHTAIVWIVAILGMIYGPQFSGEATEPYLKIASAMLIIGVALWVAYRTWQENRARNGAVHHYDHDHHHKHGHDHHHDHGYSHSPHEHHDHAHPHDKEMPIYNDAHSRAHAEQIQKQLAGKPITTGQIILFGLTGGLIPCPAAITVLILCLQLKQFILGILLVAAFSIGLALTLVASGVVAAWGMKHAAKRWKGIDAFMAKAPYFSSAVIICLGLYIGWQGLHQLGAI
jgi:ABC-type nickel/cobalt efflux system permease component RcnA